VLFVQHCITVCVQPFDTSSHSMSLNVTTVRGLLAILYELAGSITGRKS
jgi:hypothetical protein